MDGTTPVPYFWVASREGTSPIGVSAFRGEASTAAAALLGQLPEGVAPAGTVGLFPCFTRGVNQYGKEDVESAAIVSSLPGAHVYGMFAHGELGPQSFSGYVGPQMQKPHAPCTQHSMTSILVIHTQ